MDDMAEATVFLMKNYSDAQHINAGVGDDVTILELAQQVAQAVGFSGSIHADPSRPDGTPRKLLDVSRIHALGWRARIGLWDGIVDTYKWYVDQGAGAVAGASVGSRGS